MSESVSVGMVVADMNVPGCPLAYINEGFKNVTGIIVGGVTSDSSAPHSNRTVLSSTNQMFLAFFLCSRLSRINSSIHQAGKQDTFLLCRGRRCLRRILSGVCWTFLVNISGYGKENIGRNSKFLQGPETEGYLVEEIMHALQQHEPLCVKLHNHKADGRKFQNLLCLHPVFGREGEYLYQVRVKQSPSEAIPIVLYGTATGSPTKD